jgi:hypothetical protein
MIGLNRKCCAGPSLYNLRNAAVKAEAYYETVRLVETSEGPLQSVLALVR